MFSASNYIAFLAQTVETSLPALTVKVGNRRRDKALAKVKEISAELSVKVEEVAEKIQACIEKHGYLAPFTFDIINIIYISYCI